MQNKKLKKIIDLLMLLSLFFLMGYFYFDKSSHMLIGILCFVLFIIHQILNMSWYKTLLKGKYTYPRIIIFIINVLLLLCMLLQMISGFMMSSYISGIHQGMALFRRIFSALLLVFYFGCLSYRNSCKRNFEKTTFQDILFSHIFIWFICVNKEKYFSLYVF